MMLHIQSTNIPRKSIPTSQIEEVTFLFCEQDLYSKSEQNQSMFLVKNESWKKPT